MMIAWQFTVEPYENEILSSWLVRIAQANYTHLYALFSHSDYKRSIYKNDLDLIPYSSGFYEWLSQMTDIGIERIRKMSLQTYEGYVQERITQHPKQSWIITMGQFKAHGYRFCPECLKEHAYFRKEWRLLLVNVCSHHSVYLSNHCDACDAPIVPQLIDEHSTLVSCYRCGYDLRQNHLHYIDLNHEHIAATQQKLLQIANQGYYFHQNRWHYSVGLFDILHRLVLFFARNKHIGLKRGDLCKLESKMMSELIESVMDIFDKWPRKFQEFCQNNRISNHFRLFDRFPWEKLPMWFVDVSLENIKRLRDERKFK